MAVFFKSMDNEKETLQQVSDTTLEQPVTITVDVEPQGALHKILQKWGVLPKKRVFVIKPIYLGTLVRVSKLILSLGIKLPDKNSDTASLMEANYQAIADHSYTMAEIVALAIQNNRQSPDPKLIAFVMNNFTAREMMTVLTVVLRQMDLKNFMSSIISVRGLNVLVSQTAAPVMPVSGTEVSL